MIGNASSKEVYLDSSLVVAAMIDGLPHSRACAAFCSHSIADSSHVYFSQILRLEIAEAVRKLATRAQLPEDLRDEYQLQSSATDPLIRQQWMACRMSQFALLIGKFHEVSELPFRIRMWHRSVQIMARYALGSHDAVHVATALLNGVDVFATADHHCVCVETLDILLIHDTPPNM